MGLILPDCVDKTIEKALDPLATKVGNTFGDIWDIATRKISIYAEKIRIDQQYYIEEFKKICDEKYERIPIEQRIEPNIQVICQALEDAKYCVSNETIREMFANLIVSTMDKETCGFVHPSFSATLKQMSPNDAKLFSSFYCNSKKAICNFILKSDDNPFFTNLLEFVYLENTDTNLDDVETLAFCFSTLEKLGVIKISFNKFLPKSAYKVFEESKIFFDYKKTYELKQKKVDIQRGVAELTILGKKIMDICCTTKRIKIKTILPSDLL